MDPLIFWGILAFAAVIAFVGAKEAGQARKRCLEAEALLKVRDEALAEATKMRDTLVARGVAMETIYQQRKTAFPWLASAYADFHALEAERDAQALATKKHRAIKAADVLREHGERRRKAERLARWATYRVAYFQSLFPWLADYIGDDVPDYAVQASEATENETGDDPVRTWLPAGQYEKLSTVERNQMALDRWKAQTRRSNWEIGRDYERFIGWTYESLGYAVEYTGAIEGFRDMGRDLVCRRGSDFRIVQCKYWRQEKEIHEKHVFQLFGSAMEYAFKSGHPLESVKAVLHTSTKLSEVAKKAAELLHVEFHESVALGDYPLIKCNIRNKQKIYHLPFDQLYDRAHITQAGEQYCYTVKEAEDAGFRRAWKWRGQQDAA